MTVCEKHIHVKKEGCAECEQEWKEQTAQSAAVTSAAHPEAVPARKTFTVRRVVDAYAIYETEVEAESAEEAVKLASNDESKYDWGEADLETFDARNYVAIDEDGEEIEGTCVGDL